MCRSLSEGGRRCDCQLGERRRAYQRGLYAKRKAQREFKRTRRTSTPTPPAPAAPFDWRSVDPKELTDEQIDTAVAQLREERVTLTKEVGESWDELITGAHDFEDISDPRYLPEELALGDNAARDRYVASVAAVGNNVEEAAFLRAAGATRDNKPLTKEEEAQVRQTRYEKGLENIQDPADRERVQEYVDAGIDPDKLLRSNLFTPPVYDSPNGLREMADPDPDQLSAFMDIIDPDGSQWESFTQQYPDLADNPAEQRRRFMLDMRPDYETQHPRATLAQHTRTTLAQLSRVNLYADMEVADHNLAYRRREGVARQAALKEELANTVSMGEGWSPEVRFYGAAGKNKATREQYAQLLSDASSVYPTEMLESVGRATPFIRLASNPRNTARGGQFRASVTRKDKVNAQIGFAPETHDGQVILRPLGQADPKARNDRNTLDSVRKLVDDHNATLGATGKKRARLQGPDGYRMIGRLEVVDHGEDGYRVQTTSPQRFVEMRAIPEIEADFSGAMVHEVGHIVERHNPRVALACKQFLDQRRKRSGAVKNRVGSARYEAVQDAFVDDYSGRDYPDSVHTEVFTTGVEGMFGWDEDSPYHYRNYLTPPEEGKPEDAEHRQLVLGLLAAR